MESVSCIICGGVSAQPFLEVTDRFSTSKEKFNLVKCSCGFVYLNPRPTENEIGPYYDNPNYDPHSTDDTTVFSKSYRLIQKLALRQKRRKIEKHMSPGTVLDIGGGQGEFCDYMNHHNWQAVLQDKSTAALSKASDSDLVKINDLSELSENHHFDLITMWHALEHIHDVEGTFHIVSRYLNPGGIIVIAVPNRDATEQKYYKNQWAPWDAPRHLYHFSIEDLETFVKQKGFDVLEKFGLKQDTPYNILLSMPDRSLKSILSAGLILVNSWFQSLLFGVKSHSSMVFICKK